MQKFSRVCGMVSVCALVAGAGTASGFPGGGGGSVHEAIAAGTRQMSEADHPGLMRALGLKRCRVATAQVGEVGGAGNGRTVSSALKLSVDIGDAAHPHLCSFELDPYPLRTKDFRVMVSDGRGGLVEAAAPAPCTYHGVDRATGDEIWAAVVGGKVRGTVVPGDGGETVHVQPLADADTAADGSSVAVYSASDMTASGGTCGVDAPASGVAAPAFVPRSASCKIVELVADADYPFYQANGSSVANTVQDIESVMLGVNAIYRGQSGFSTPIRFGLKQVTVRTSNASDPYKSLAVPPSETDPQTMLGIENSTWSGVNNPSHDIVHLFTGRDLTGSTVGLGYLNAGTNYLCSGGGYSLVQSRFSTNLAARVEDSAHELGHNMSFSHDSSSGYIMYPSINSSNPATSFSPQSVNEFNTYVPSFACLNDDYPDVVPDYATTVVNTPVTIDVLANDGQGVICTSPVTSFTLPSSTTALGGTVGVSVGTGPGGRNQVTYTPPVGVSGVNDSFSYSAAGQSVGVSVTVVGARQPDPLFCTVPGLKATYYQLTSISSNGFPSFSGLQVIGTGTAGQINYPVTTGGAVGGPQNGFEGATFDGYIQVPATGVYTFSLLSDDRSQLYIGSTLVLDGGSFDSASESTSAGIALAAGRHAIEARYFNYQGNTTLVLSWTQPGQAKTVVPASAFSHAAGTCGGDCDGMNNVSVSDIFTFLRAWFAKTPQGDFDGVGGVTVGDIFAFLRDWFGGC